MSAEIHVLPGVERCDLAEPAPDAEVLAQAAANGVRDVVVVGLDRGGGLYVASAQGDPDRVVGQLMRAVQQLAGMRLEHHAEDAARTVDNPSVVDTVTDGKDATTVKNDEPSR